MMKKLHLLFSIKKKIISSVMVGFLLVASFAPLSNIELQALSISINVIKSSPTMLNVFSLTEINDIVMTKLFAELDNLGGLGDSWPEEGSQKRRNTNNESCILGKDIKNLLSVKITRLSGRLSFHCIDAASEAANLLNIEYDLGYKAKFNLVTSVYLDTLIVQMARLLPLAAIARAGIDGTSIYKIIDSAVSMINL